MYTERVYHRSRRCGTCSACCITPKIDELDKPENTPCSHLRPGNVRGTCGIYGQRPEQCRKFLCAWLMEPRMPEEMRPDKSGFVLNRVADDDDGRPVLEIWELTEKPWEGSEVFRWFYSLPQSDHFITKVRRYERPEDSE